LSLFTCAQARGDVRSLFALRPLADEPLRLVHRLRPGGKQFADDPLDGLVEISGNLLHQPDAQGGLRVEAFTGEEVPPCLGADLR
jgi:hypothetical protein